MDDPNQREKDIIQAALQLPLNDRAVYLDQACGEDAQLRQRVVEALFRGQEKAAATAQASATAPQSSTIVVSPPVEEAGEKPGEWIGHYKLLEKIGEGGMGSVWVAEQREPVRREKVAVKLIKVGMDTKQVIARFEAERQALALMDHPNIAKVLDAGATDTGRPYFVMEYVAGEPITVYCDKNKLSPRERLELFIQVCKGIQHAHQKGIIHRDISPSNILVTLCKDETDRQIAVPKIIDFGIAKATEGRILTEKTVYTALGEFVGKPAYMAPEQAEMSGLGVDTRSDIYALGAVLYELLTGQTPFEPKRLAQAGLDEICRIIREEEPPRPSTKIGTLDNATQTTIAKRRQLEPPKLIHQVRGDLDWIVMKCLEKDRARRYETANGLARDVERHLNNEPVVAGPPSTGYRFRKLVLRNKLAFTAAAAVATSLVLGLGFSIHYGIREKKAREKAEVAKKAALREAQKNRQITDLFAYIELSVIDRAPPNQRKELTALWGQAAKILDREEVRSQPEVEADLRMRFGVMYIYLEERQKAEAMLRRVQELRPKIGDANQAVTVLLWYGRADPLFRGGQISEAEKATHEILESAKTNGPIWLALAALGRLAEIRSGRGDLRDAEILYRDALALHRKSLALIPLASCKKSDFYGELVPLLQRQGKVAEAEQLLTEASKELTTSEYADALGLAGGGCARHGLWKVAANYYSDLVELEPEKREDCCSFLGVLLLEMGDLDGYRKCRTRMLARFAGTANPAFAEGQAKANLVLPLSGADLVGVAKLADTAVTWGRDHPPNPYAELTKGWAEYRQGKFSSAVDWLQRALRGQSWFNNAQACMVLAMTRQRLGESDAALAAFAEGSRLIETRSRSFVNGDIGLSWYDWIIARALRTEAEGLLEVDRPEQAAKLKKCLAEAYRKHHRKEVAYYRKAAESGKPQDLNALAWLLATCSEAELRDGLAAVGLAEKAVQKTGRKDAMILDTLAAAYAEAGQFPKATSAQKEAIALLQDERQKKDFTSRLKLYEANSPYHEPE